MYKSEKGNNSVEFRQNFMKSLSGDLLHNVALLHKTPKSEKRDNSFKYLQNFAKR